MIKNEAGRVVLNNINLIEYNEEPIAQGRFFVQVGIAGIYCSERELKDLYTVLNYYCNIEDFSECNIKVGEENVNIR
jgi:hypothetical protein